ncbi:hypothetical protein KWH01_21095 [Xanthomonas campestris pv. merremiae]|uniref:Uncharacterized protein n=1 Tax=Xanthomonas cassavae CFBP 4642 TaxID=1219375 RepID=A0ABS8HJX3_9XANT|nr:MULTISPECIES: hypothetical protein [Xanthomonas]MBV6839656.1 hypothetical protein [Xanthomonas campestris pv. merremiae]ASK98986.1 hypothetical protein XcvCFBP7112P_22500 [Xanthomonas citri pv. vignicola]MBV6851660.1 hypothetical protein [Xanthomonas campestris pv. heliotropii]MBZ3934542.1 hypothetical protein [Xanthomonas campestris pv. merremiae]MCC4622499.1 hypothetical protein [Xanthomonas cassavae CFBP 4642]
MKPVNKMLLIVALLPFADSALADGVSGVQRPQQVMSDKDKWACEVAMCLANPQGPTAVSECKPPIDKMRRELAKGNSIPKCRFLGSNNSGGGGTSTGGSEEEQRQAQQLRR